VRDRDGLRRGLDEVHRLSRTLEGDGELDDVTRATHASIALVGTLILRAALRREESRGGHRRADFPARDDVKWKVHVAETGPSQEGS
jgi:L-aspartate oxidase